LEKKLSPIPAMPIGYVKEAPMKTLAEFIQRLQDDPAFEKQAQAFDNGEDLMAFVKSEGYDFTLEQLTIEFKHEAKLGAEAGETAPAPQGADAPPGQMDQDAAFPGGPEAVPEGEPSPVVPTGGSHDFNRQQASEGFETPEAEEESPEGMPRINGGRHRGFSSQRLKSVSGEEP
jgi:predicted ribosomally synthesized peptide with nif11-like leader